jgi:predicted nucleic acid-binding protein
MKLPRIYCDSSVIGGYFDPEFERESRRFIDAVKNGRIVMLLSEVVIQEILLAPENIQNVLASIPTSSLERVPLSTEIIELRNAYIKAGILSPKWIDDATHVAAATVARADAIVSWNFSHIVRLDKMKAYNQVNLINGYGILTIVSPQEVHYDNA